MLKYLKFYKIIICFKELQRIAEAKTDKQQKKLIKEAKECVIDAISEIALNCLKGNVPLIDCDFKKLSKYKKILRKISKVSPVKNRKIYINQKGGFLSLLIPPALSLISGILGSYIEKKIRK